MSAGTLTSMRSNLDVLIVIGCMVVAVVLLLGWPR
jgi:hypothetical protein